MQLLQLQGRVLAMERGCVMMPWIVAGGLTVVTSLLMLDDSEPPPPTAPEPVVAAQTESIDSLSSAIFWIGSCGVVSSAIGAFTVIQLAKLRRKGGEL